MLASCEVILLSRARYKGRVELPTACQPGLQRGVRGVPPRLKKRTQEAFLPRTRQAGTHYSTGGYSLPGRRTPLTQETDLFYSYFSFSLLLSQAVLMLPSRFFLPLLGSTSTAPLPSRAFTAHRLGAAWALSPCPASRPGMCGRAPAPPALSVRPRAASLHGVVLPDSRLTGRRSSGARKHDCDNRARPAVRCGP